MRRDLRKYLQGKTEEEWESLPEQTEQFDRYLARRVQEDGLLSTASELWCDAQLQFLDDLIADIDSGIEKVFRGKNRVKHDKAQAVAEEERLKAWLRGKHKQLKAKNSKATS